MNQNDTHVSLIIFYSDRPLLLCNAQGQPSGARAFLYDSAFIWTTAARSAALPSMNIEFW